MSAVRNFIAPATITSALLYYFGWLRSQAIADAFGYDASLLGFSTQDYVLRSVQPMAVPVLIGVALTIGWRRAHATLRRSLKAGGLRRLTGRAATMAMRLAGYAIAAVAVVAVVAEPDLIVTANWLLPLTLAAGALLIFYGTWLQGFAQGGPSYALSTEVRWTVTALIVAAAFVGVSRQAWAEGEAQARENVAEIPGKAVVTLTAGTPLALAGVPSYVDGTQHVYSGMVLMFTENGHHFLLPTAYEAGGNERVYTIPVAAARLDLNSTTFPPCSGFEDLEPGASFAPGDSFASGGARYVIARFPPAAGAGAGPEAVVERTDGDTRLRLRGVMLEPFFDAPYVGWDFDYDVRAVGVGVAVNGQLVVADAMSQIAQSGELAGAIAVAGGATGQVQLLRNEHHLTSVGIGGTDLVVDCNP